MNSDPEGKGGGAGRMVVALLLFFMSPYDSVRSNDRERTLPREQSHFPYCSKKPKRRQRFCLIRQRLG
jgi:hypothetical protein